MPEIEQQQNILDMISAMNNGGLLQDINKKLEEVLKAVEETGGKGVVNLKLKIAANEDDTVNIVPELSINKPNRKRSASTFFLHKGGLYKEDPKQMSLPLSSGNLRSINS